MSSLILGSVGGGGIVLLAVGLAALRVSRSILRLILAGATLVLIVMVLANFHT